MNIENYNQNNVNLFTPSPTPQKGYRTCIRCKQDKRYSLFPRLKRSTKKLSRSRVCKLCFKRESEIHPV